MQQNNIWMNYLGIGIFSLFLLFTLNSCKKHASGRIDWIYINETEYEIAVHSVLESFTLEPLGENILTDITPLIDDDDNPYDFSLHYSSIEILKYNMVKCDTIKKTREGFWDISNYQVEKLSDSYYQYTYRFTEADYERAINCE